MVMREYFLYKKFRKTIFSHESYSVLFFPKFLSLQKFLFLAFVLTLSSLLFASVSYAKGKSKKGKEAEEQEAFSPEIGNLVVKAQNVAGEGKWAEAISFLNKAEKKGLSNFGASVIYRLEGQAYYNLDRYDEAIRYWNKAINTGKLKSKEALGLQFSIARLYIANEQYKKGVLEIEKWIRMGGKATESTYMMMAKAYAQAKEYGKARPYAEKAYHQANPKKRKHFDLLNFIYNQMGLKAEQAKLVEQMISRYPKDEQLWKIWISLLAQADKDKEVFEANKMMYLNGFFKKENEIIKLASYYSYFDVPYQAADLLQKEMSTGRVSKNKKNLEQLMNYLSSAREYKKAIPVIQKLLQKNPSGRLYRRLGEAYIQILDYKKAEEALKKAINAGGENNSQLWFMIGTSMYQRSDRKGALDIFSKCASSNRSCQGWVKFIHAEIQAEQAKHEWKLRLAKEECYQTVRRLREQAALQGVVDDTGRVVVEIPSHCKVYYDKYGIPVSTAENIQEESAEATSEKKG